MTYTQARQVAGLRTFNRDLLSALATMTIESVQQRRVSS
jgi:hypothetical protein